MTETFVHISYLERSEIDTVKWDNCISNCPNGLIYARSFYLDTMAKNWSALIYGDYTAVMPLTWNRKYGIAYLYQPPFVAQAGLFNSTDENVIKLDHFIQAIKSRFRFCDILLNYSNTGHGGALHPNYILDLNKSYSAIRSGYKKRLVENLKESEAHHLSYGKSDDFSRIIRSFQYQYGSRFPHVRTSDYQRFETLCKNIPDRNMIFIREVKSDHGDLLQSSLFFRDERRIYNIMSVTPEAGRIKRAHFFLIDNLIREFASHDLILDFEGSEIPGIAEFYQKFGSSNQPFPRLRYNLLPFPFRFFKRLK